MARTALLNREVLGAGFKIILSRVSPLVSSLNSGIPILLMVHSFDRDSSSIPEPTVLHLFGTGIQSRIVIICPTHPAVPVDADGADVVQWTQIVYDTC